MILYFHAPGTLNRWERFPLHTPQLGLHNNGWLCLGRQMTGCVRQSSGLLLLKCFPPPLSPANHLTHVFNCNSWSNYWKGFLPQSVDGQCCRQSVETGVHNSHASRARFISAAFQCWHMRKYSGKSMFVKANHSFYAWANVYSQRRHSFEKECILLQEPKVWKQCQENKVLYKTDQSVFKHFVNLFIHG